MIVLRKNTVHDAVNLIEYSSLFKKWVLGLFLQSASKEKLILDSLNILGRIRLGFLLATYFASSIFN
jgi:hypothetical protein